MKKPYTRSMRFYHVAHLIKRIEILFISFDSMFQDYFLLYFFFNVLRLLFVSFDSMFQDFSSLTHTKNSFHFHLPFSLLLLYIHMPITLYAIPSQILSNKKRYHLLSTFQ